MGVVVNIEVPTDDRTEMMLDAVKYYDKMNRNILIVTHDAMLTRLMDICLANKNNIIPRHVPETTTIMIDRDKNCYFRYPTTECHAKEFMNRENLPSSAYMKYGSMSAYLNG